MSHNANYCLKEVVTYL